MSKRRICNVLEFHIGLMDQLLSFENGVWVAHPERFFAIPDISKHMANFLGALHAGTPVADLHVDEKAEILFGDFSRKEFYARTDEIVCYPFRMPAQGTLHIATSEFNGTRWARTLIISEKSGDMSAPIGSPLRSDGTLPDIYLTVGAQFPAGKLLYANNVLAEEPSIPNSANSGTSIVWPAP